MAGSPFLERCLGAVMSRRRRSFKIVRRSHHQENKTAMTEYLVYGPEHVLDEEVYYGIVHFVSDGKVLCEGVTGKCSIYISDVNCPRCLRLTSANSTRVSSKQ